MAHEVGAILLQALHPKREIRKLHLALLLATRCCCCIFCELQLHMCVYFAHMFYSRSFGVHLCELLASIMADGRSNSRYKPPLAVAAHTDSWKLAKHKFCIHLKFMAFHFFNSLHALHAFRSFFGSVYYKLP